MSKWYSPKLEDIDLDTENGEEYLNILIDQDREGNIWVELKVKDILKKIKEHKEI